MLFVNYPFFSSNYPPCEQMTQPGYEIKKHNSIFKTNEDNAIAQKMAPSRMYILLIKNEIKPLLLGLLTAAATLFCNDIRSQTNDTTRTINFPLLHEDLSLYDFASVRMETDKTETPPADITKRKFQPVKEIFEKDELHFADSIKSFWIKFQIANNHSSDTTVSLIFFPNVSKGILYKAEGDDLMLIGKAGFVIAVLKRNLHYQENRIDVLLKAHSKTTYFIQVILFHFGWIPKMPVLENFNYAEMKALNFEIEVRRPFFLWSHIFTGIFLMFFIFGFIKYLVVGKDRAWLYYSMMGLFAAIGSIVFTESPPFELPSFENLRGVELSDMVYVLGLIMQALFVLEILQLKIKYPRITQVIKWYLFAKLLLYITTITNWIVSHDADVFKWIETYDAWFFNFFLVGSWVVYLATIRKGFYRFIFLGALTIFIAGVVIFIVRWFELFYLLPAWFGFDPRGSTGRFMQTALVIDMIFYFTGLAYRDREVEKDKNLVQEQLKLQKLESERSKAELRQQAAELEMQALRAQMNPHFIFNSLNSINRFILQNNKTLASEYLTKFSKLVRMILQNSQAPLIPLESELESLQLYLELETVRFDHHFEFKINIHDDLDISSVKVPPLIIQPYTENAIWHGLMHKEEKGHLSIDIEQSNDELLLKITDDGIGRKEAAILAAKSTTRHKSMGLKITADRIAMLQRLDRNESTVTINDLVHADGSAAGTEVVIKMPLIYENT